MSEKKEEVVISGIGGMFPECENVNELKDLLFNKINGVSIDSRRWEPIDGKREIDGIGKLKNVDQFDNTFFMTHPKLAEYMDPMTRIFLERSIEAIFDAGLSLADFHGTNTAVFSSWFISDTEMFTAMDGKASSTSFGMLGRSRTMQANRVSYVLNLIGPSYTMDGSWICSSNSLEKAKQLIEDGSIPAAIVGVSNLILRPETQFQYQGLNRLNHGDRTKPFSSDADGYNRSEACIVLLLQRASEAKRSYGTLLSVKSKQFGNHQGHITSHNGQHLKSLLLDCYKDANIDPASVEFIEANGSGIQSEDSMELNILEEVFCCQKREIPLKVGSIKSNIGHCEIAGLFASIVKAIIALDSGYIPPNINYASPNKNVAALQNGTIKVVTEKTHLSGDIIGVSSFGFSNAFSHVILKRNKKVKIDYEDINSDSYIPRLILASGRTENNTRDTVKKIKMFGHDSEYLALINNVFTKTINAHFYRCYSIYPSLDETRIDDVWNVSLKKPPVWFIFSGMGSQWQGMGTHFMKLPIFADAINKCDSILKPRGVDIKHILTSQDTKLFDNILNSFVGIAAVQIGLVAVLKALDITPDGIIGHSVGELGCAYADGCFTAEEMILSAYARGRASIETELIPGMMAAIGLGYHQIKDKLPHDVDVACRNSDSSCTVSGPVDSINKFVSELKAEGIFAKSVNAAGIAYHSRYIQKAGPTLLKYLKEVIKEPKLRSSKWISSSIPEAQWKSELAKYSSPEYHTNNLLSSVLFEDALKHIPSDAITIEIAPHGLLQSIMKGALPETVTNISLTKKIYGDSIQFMLNAIGKMYVSGLNPAVQNIYQKVEFPIGSGTPSIQNLPFWDHTNTFIPLVFLHRLRQDASGERFWTSKLNENIYLVKNRIHDHYILPLSYLICNVWKVFVEMNGQNLTKLSVEFLNLKFKNNVIIHPTNLFDSYLMIQTGSGLFEYSINKEVIFSGQINFSDNSNVNQTTEKSLILDKTSNDFYGSIPKDEIYTIMKNNRFDIGDDYKNITNCDVYKNNIQGFVDWNNDWIYFLDGLFKFPLLENYENCIIKAPTAIRRINIIPTLFLKNIKKGVFVDYNKASKDITCNGVTISEVKYSPLILPTQKSKDVKLEEQSFIHFKQIKCKNINDFVYDAMDIIMETEKLGLESTKKLILCTRPFDNNVISKECTTILKQIIVNQPKTNSIILDWEKIEKVSEDNESGRFITVATSNYLQDTTKAFSNKKCCYMFVSSDQKLQDLNDWKIITQQKCTENNFLALMKKKIPIKEKSLFIKVTHDEIDLSIRKALKNSNEIIYIISNNEPSETIKDVFIKYSKLRKLRFVFILDSKAPEFETNKSFYMDQLSIDFMVNIYKNGGWGSYKRIKNRDFNDNNIKVTNSPICKSVVMMNSKDKLTIKCMGLNFNDFVIEDNTESIFGPVEYSGIMNNNTKVMGITSFVQMSSKTPYDSILSWPVPSTWSLEDAATVPLTYAMGYYLFKILFTFDGRLSNHSILVTSGLHPIGQAAISIGLAAKCEVYVVVDSYQQADQLSNLFPKLPRSKILLNKHSNFDVQVKMITKSRGIDFILNFLSGNDFYAATRSVSKGGQIFEFTKSDMKNQARLGTRIFLKNISYSVVSSSQLLNESDHNKQIIRQAFLNGLNEGVINPFYSHVTTMSSMNSTIFNTMTIASKSPIPKKLVLTLNDDTINSKCLETFTDNSFQCDNNQVYVIIGDKSNWLELVEWLVDRGAQKIVIVVNRYLMSSIASRRFSKIIAQNISVQLESDICLKTKESSLNWLNRLASSNVIGSLFLVEQLDVKKIQNLRYAFEKLSNKTKTSSFICLLSKGEPICAELKSNGLNALNISYKGFSSQLGNIPKLLPFLDKLLQKSNSAETSSFVCMDANSNKLKWSNQINDMIKNFFPGSAEELQIFHDKITTEAKYVEVQTKSPKLSQLKSVLPVFVIPGFKPKLIDTLYKQLLYPAFEAQIPEHFNSIDELSEILVDKLQDITNQSYVSLIGESWGGIVALKMAQILEAKGTLVTVILLEGDTNVITSLAKSFFSNDNFIYKLNTQFSSYYNEYTKLPTVDIKYQLQDTFQRSFERVTKRVSSTIHLRLKALLECKPFSNKLLTNILVFRYERLSEISKTDLDDYCINLPLVYIRPVQDSKQMLVDKENIKTINKGIVYINPNGEELPLCEKYKNFNYFFENYIKDI